MTEDEANLLGPVIQRAPMPHAAGMDALEARLVTVQEVPPKVELQFFAVRGQDRTRMPSPAAHAMVRELIPQRPIGELSDVELLVEVSVLRAEAMRMRPVYAAAKAWRADRRQIEQALLTRDHEAADRLIAAVDAAISDEEKT
jgi:hypothetical protein